MNHYHRYLFHNLLPEPLGDLLGLPRRRDPEEEEYIRKRNNERLVATRTANKLRAQNKSRKNAKRAQ